MIYLLFLIGFFSSLLLMDIFLPLFKRLKVKQFIREEGPKSHYIKKGTPTMGGIIFILGSILFYIFIILSLKIDIDDSIILIIMPPLLFLLIGFIDDYLITIKHNNNGLKPELKLMMQVVMSIIYFIIYLNLNYNTAINFFSFSYDFKWLYGIIILLMLVGSSNAVNLTDGIDGLAGGITFILLIFYFVLGIKLNNSLLTYYILSIMAFLLGFLVYNFHPAKIFMGDSGSLALGCIIANIAILTKTEMLLLILGLPYIIETLSVIIQVLYFKMFKKRIFKMAPIHHHMELCGMNEYIICTSFYLLELIIIIILFILIF